MKLLYACKCNTEYFNFKRENEFKRFVVFFHCFSDNCCRATAGGNEIDPHQSSHHLFKGSLELWAHSHLWCPLIPYPKHCGDLVWRMLTLCKGPLPVGYARLVERHADVTLQAGKIFHQSILYLVFYTTEVYASWACLYWLLVSPFAN